MPEKDKQEAYDGARYATEIEIAANEEAQREARQRAIYDAQMKAIQSSVAGDAQNALNDTIRATVVNGPKETFVPQSGFDAVYDGWQKIEDDKRRQRIAMNEADPKLRRSENARKWMAGIGEALASVANLGAVANNASNQRPQFMTPEIGRAIEADRLRRKADVQRLDKEIDNIQSQKMRLGVSMATQEARDRNNAANIAVKQNIADNNFILGKMKEDRLAGEGKEKIAGMWARIENTKKRNDDLSAQGRQRIAISEARLKLAEKKWEAKSKNRGSGAVEFAYSNMLNEIAKNSDFADWKALEESARAGDQYARKMVNMFSIPKDKANIGKMKAMISEYAEDYAPEFYEEYFNEEPDEPQKVDIFGLGKQSKKIKVF